MTNHPASSQAAVSPEASQTLTAQWLTREAFAPFGEVIELRQGDDPNAFAINGGMTLRHHDLARVDVGPEGRALINLFETQPVAFPLTVSQLERHPLGSQAFMPMTARPFVVVVAPTGEGITNSEVRVFVTNGRQGVNYHRGVWHHPLLALEPSCFVVLDRGGPGDNCDELALTAPLRVELPDGV